METKTFPATAVEFDERFHSESACRSYLMSVRWPKGFICPRCGHTGGWQLHTRDLIECGRCHVQTSLTAGTIFHRSRKPLRLWFKAIFLAASQKTGISAFSLKRQLGLSSYQTAWTWLHKIRKAMVRPGRTPLFGLVEIDETYVGGEEEGAIGRQTGKKTVVVVAVEDRGGKSGRVRLTQTNDAKSASLLPFIARNVAEGSTIKTDDYSAYKSVKFLGCRHTSKKVTGNKKAANQFLPLVHRAASLLKRWLLGTYQGAVSHKHLPAYLNEFEFRFNRRGSRYITLPFQRVCEFAVVTHPVTYKQLVTQHIGVA